MLNDVYKHITHQPASNVLFFVNKNDFFPRFIFTIHHIEICNWFAKHVSHNWTKSLITWWRIYTCDAIKGKLVSVNYFILLLLFQWSKIHSIWVGTWKITFLYNKMFHYLLHTVKPLKTGLPQYRNPLYTEHNLWSQISFFCINNSFN